MGLPLYSRVLTHSLKKEKTFSYALRVRDGIFVSGLSEWSQVNISSLGLLPSDQTGLRLPTYSSCESS